MQGKLLVFEGIDGSGKTTQTKLLIEKLKSVEKTVSLVDFPQYGHKSAGLVEEYLAGTYGTLDQVTPQQASIFFAVDRFDASFSLKEKLDRGDIVISNRYVGSNAGHQGGKIQSITERKEFLTWLFHLEYEILQIPKPELSFILNIPPELAKKLTNERAAEKGVELDIHEKELSHFQNTHTAYAQLIELFPDAFIPIECAAQGAMLTPQEIHEQIWEKVQKLV